MPVDVFRKVDPEMRHLLKESGLNEFKWSRLRTARNRFAAEKILNVTMKHICERTMRIDVLVWDTSDSRHLISGRDDSENLHRMYFHLIKNVLRDRWPDECIWRLCPDEHKGMRWDSLKDVLDNVSWKLDRSRLTNGIFHKGFDALIDLYEIESIKPVQSKDTPLTQLADLVAGMAVYSRKEHCKYQGWLKQIGPQNASLFDEPYSEGLNNTDIERCIIMSSFNDMCKKYRLGVSMNKYHGFRTMNPKYPINFWWYVPQHEDDKAPVKQRQIDM
ncbi:MAG: hypothetical protein BWY28_02439 [bacterium ADurb.Bin236]|nr:MAG: hypothetical protein BWY28_02439 [bacterium ADurb.Bin236]